MRLMLPIICSMEVYSCSSIQCVTSSLSALTYCGPRFKSAETSWTALAPDMRAWMASRPVWTPPVAPSDGTPIAGDGSDPDAAHLKVLYAITPVDDHNTLDFWAVCRDFALGDESVDTGIAEMNRAVVLQDVVALNLIEERLGDDWAPVEVSLKIDTGGLAGRRVLAEMVAAE